MSPKRSPSSPAKPKNREKSPSSPNDTARQNIDAASSDCRWIQPHAEGVVLTIAAQPGARKSGFDRLHDGAMKLKVQAPPVEGAANEAIIDFIAKTFGVRRSAVRILVGEFARRKSILVTGINLTTVQEKILSQPNIFPNP